MGLLARLSALFKAKANAALNKAEDPRETLDYSYELQLEQLQKVRRGVADVATSHKRLELQASQLGESAAKLEEQAKEALAINREDLAREALARRSAINAEIVSITAQRDQLAAEEQKLIEAEKRLEARVESFRTHKEVIKATYTAAEAETHIGEAVSGISEEMGDVGLAMQRAEDKTAQMTARAGAIDELLASGALNDLTQPTDPIEAELEKARSAGDVETELARIKGEIAEAPAAALPSPEGSAP